MTFYSKALGFVRRGPPNAKQIRMVRGGNSPRAGPRGILQPASPGAQVMLRVEQTVRPTSVWIMVRNTDGKCITDPSALRRGGCEAAAVLADNARLLSAGKFWSGSDRVQTS